jgi:hypothetical protein
MNRTKPLAPAAGHLEERETLAIALVRSVLTPDLLHRDYAGLRTIGVGTDGHCASAAEAVYFLLGGPRAGLAAWVARDADGTTHWWLQTQDGRRIDPTADQFAREGTVPPYMRGILGRAGGFMGQRIDPDSPYGFNRRPGRTAAEILRRVETSCRTVREPGHLGPGDTTSKTACLFFPPWPASLPG